MNLAFQNESLDDRPDLVLSIVTELASEPRNSREAHGKTEAVVLQNGVLRLNLPGGTGDLFKYTAQPFPGTEN